MSSVFVTQPLHDIGPRPDPRAHCLPNSSYSRRDHDGPVNTWLTFTGGLPTPPISKAMIGQSVAIAQNLQHTHIPPTRYQHVPTAAASMRQSLSQSSYGSQTSHQASKPQGNAAVGERDKNAIASHLQIPESVNKSKGSLAEFAAEITCLFWFESSETLDIAEKTPKDAYVTRGLTTDSIPSAGFRKWVTTILSTTQVSKEVILLALMFIYRLKKFNPTVSGKRGSEFRLLTIALMLGNKFLDDNTYTNKTWAEVSGISVAEIHIMEVEFLSNMRYELYASESQWYEWKEMLGRLGAFYEKASVLPHTDAQPITPTTQSFAHRLPSPPSTHGNSSMKMSVANYTAMPNPASTAPKLPRSPLRQRQTAGSDSTPRKRSLDASEARPAKRMHYQGSDIPFQTNNLPAPQSYVPPVTHALPAPYYSSSSSNPAGMNPEALRLPVPRLPGQISENQLAPLNVPPVSRAMGSVFPPATAAYSQPITPLSTTSSGLYPTQIPNLGLYPASHNNNGMPSHTSPTAYGTSTPTLPGLSPSHFLGNRQSPYRPVRNVNTLLIPPPSAALQNSVRNIAAEQIRYQPLGKASHEYRSGPVPHLHPDNFQQSNTPLAQKYPYRF
ncbi:hypothetical protein DV738_g4272, partial [Chaetothyriales sp. CBS 135597]